MSSLTTMIMLTVVMGRGRWTWKLDWVTKHLASIMIIPSRSPSGQRVIMLTMRR